MTFTRKIKKKEGIYLAEVENKWIEGKVVQKHIRYIGKLYTINPHITSKADQKQIRDIEIIQHLLNGKSKKDLSILYQVHIKTIENIKKRFDAGGIKGLTHTRKKKYDAIKVSTPDQAAITTDIIQNPEKSIKEIKETTGKNVQLKDIKKIVNPTLELLKSKKKILLEIQENSQME